MKGWPIVRAFVVLLFLLLAGLPLRSLTAPKPVTAVVAVPKKPDLEKISVAVIFTQPPKIFSVSFLGKKILSAENSPAFDFKTTLDAHFPPEGIDLVLEAAWADFSKKTEVSIDVIRADGSKQTRSVSGEKDIFEVLTFPGKT